MIKEIWKNLVGYDNKYQVSSLGNVRLKKDNKILNQYIGYRQNFISACCNGKKKSAYGYRWELVSDE